MVEVVEAKPKQPTRGSAGGRTQAPGSITSVSTVAQNSGGIGNGQIITRDKK